MTDTTITDAVCWPQDDGSGVPDGNEDYDSAGYLSLLAKYKGEDSYVGEDNTGSATLQFNDVDTTNEQVDVGSGFAYIMDSGTTVQSADQTTYDTTLPNSAPYVVILPTEVVDLGLGTDTDNDLWLATDPTSNDSVYIRHGSGLSAPTDPNVKLGTVNSSDGSTTRANDLGTTSLKDLNTGQADITNETLISAYPSSNQTGLASGTDHVIQFDTTLEDERGEFDTANYDFSPDETGWYQVISQARLSGLADQDEIVMKVFNKTDSSNVFYHLRTTSGTNDQSIFTSRIVELNSAKTYDVRVSNANSSFDVQAFEPTTYITVRRWFR